MKLNQRMRVAGLDYLTRRYVRRMAEGSATSSNYAIQCLNYAAMMRQENNLSSARCWIEDARRDRLAGCSILPLSR